MQGGLVARKVSVCPSSNVWIWLNGRKIYPGFIPYKRSLSLVIWKEEWLVRGDSFYLKFWVNRPRWSEMADFEPIFARSPSAVTPSEKSSINTNRKSTTRFPVSLRWSSYVAPKPPKETQKRQNGRFRFKIALRLKKVCYKVSLCENCLRESCKAFIGQSNRVKMVDGGRPLLRENFAESDPPPLKTLITNWYSFVAHQP